MRGLGTATGPFGRGRREAVCYLLGLGAMVVVSYLSVRVLGIRRQGDPPIAFPGRTVLGGMFRYDGGWYESIALNGYSVTPGRQSNVAYFPAYPLLIRAATVIVRDSVLAAMVVTALFGAAGSALFGRWCRSRNMSTTAIGLAVAALLLYPYSWFLYGVVYSDAVFVAAAVAAFLLIEDGHLGWAGVAGIIASADRPTGIAVVAGLVALSIERSGVVVHDPRGARSLVARFRVPNRIRRDMVRPIVAAPLISVFGVAAFMAYLSRRFGDALLFFHVQGAWGQGGGPNSILKRQFFWELGHHVHHSLVLTLTAQAALLVAFAVSVPFVGRRFGWAYAVFMVCLIAMPLYASRDFQGTGRYLIALFPVFALVGEWLARRDSKIRVAYLTVSGTALVVLAAGFAHGMYLA